MTNTRSCNGCTVCCTVMAVGDLGKGEYVPCGHALSGQGCAVYETRPCASCAGFRCLWLAEGDPERLKALPEGHRAPQLLQDKERPDQCGVMAVTATQSKLAFVVLRESTPGAFEGWHAQKLINRVSRKYLVCLAWQDGRRKFVGPPAQLRLAQALIDAARREHAPQRQGG